MPEKFSRLLATRLSEKTFEKLRKIAAIKRRSLSDLNRCIIENYVQNLKNGDSKDMKT